MDINGKELKTDELERMIKDNRRNAELRDAHNYLMAQINQEKNIKVKKQEMRKKVVKTSLIAGCGMALLSTANFAHEQSEGTKEIRKEIATILDDLDYGFSRASSGEYHVNIGNQQISQDDAFKNIVVIAEDKGMSPKEIAIGLDSYFGDSSLEIYVGEENKPTLAEKIAVKKAAYYEKKAEEYNKGAK